MKAILKGMTWLVVGVLIGAAGARLWVAGDAPASGEPAQSAEKPLYWVAPMDPNYRRDGPGKSPMGMDLIPVYAGDAGDTGEVRISPDVVNNLGVRTAAVAVNRMDMPIETFGHVQFDENLQVHIHSRVDGWVEKLVVKAVGDPVRKGETLLSIYSPVLVNAQEEYLAALAAGNRDLLAASEARLLALGVDRAQIDELKKRKQARQLVEVVSPQDGFITELPIKQGMFVKPAMAMMTISELDPIWVIANVYERQSALVEVGQRASITLDFLPGRELKGKVDYVYPQLDARSRTLKVRLVFPNEEHLLKPNMYTKVNIETGAGRERLTIPLEALLQGGKVDRVIVALGDGRFKAVPVRTGIESGDRIEILKGLSEGQTVVVSGQFLIDSESNIDAELARFSSGTGPDTKASATTPAGKQVSVTGRIDKVMADMRMVTVSHDPIPEWGWPAMKMNFTVTDDVDLSSVSDGERVELTIEETPDGDYVIRRLRAVVGTTPHQ